MATIPYTVDTSGLERVARVLRSLNLRQRVLLGLTDEDTDAAVKALMISATQGEAQS